MGRGVRRHRRRRGRRRPGHGRRDGDRGRRPFHAAAGERLHPHRQRQLAGVQRVVPYHRRARRVRRVHESHAGRHDRHAGVRLRDVCAGRRRELGMAERPGHEGRRRQDHAAGRRQGRMVRAGEFRIVLEVPVQEGQRRRGPHAHQQVPERGSGAVPRPGDAQDQRAADRARAGSRDEGHDRRGVRGQEQERLREGAQGRCHDLRRLRERPRDAAGLPVVRAHARGGRLYQHRRRPSHLREAGRRDVAHEQLRGRLVERHQPGRREDHAVPQPQEGARHRGGRQRAPLLPGMGRHHHVHEGRGRPAVAALRLPPRPPELRRRVEDAPPARQAVVRVRFRG